MTASGGLRPLILPVYLPTFLLSLCEGLLVPVLPLFAGELTSSYAVVGMVLAADAAGMLLLDLPAGALLRRVRAHHAMALGVLLVAAAAAAAYFASGVWWLGAARLLAGAGSALWNISRHAHLARATQSIGRGAAVSLYGGVNRAGSFLGPLAGGLLAASFGLRTPFLVLAAVALAVVPLTLRFGEVHAPDVPRAGVSPWRHLIGRHRLLLAAGLGQVMAQAIRAGRRVLVPLVGAALGLSVDQVGFVVAAAALVDVSLFVPAGLLMDRRGRKWAIVPSFLLQALGMAALGLAGGFWSLLAAACVMGLGNGLGAGTMMTLGADLAPRAALGEFLGLWRTLGDSGFLVGPLVAGLVAEGLGLGLAPAGIAALGFAAAGTFAFAVPETRRGAG